jgi:hypothetical protein
VREARSIEKVGERLAGSGEMAERIRRFDWSRTPLGPFDRWSPALLTTVGLMTSNRFPMLLWWGPDYISIYNDAYIPVLGLKHPRALGLPVRECWSEIWDILKPLIDTPFNGGPRPGLRILSFTFSVRDSPRKRTLLLLTADRRLADGSGLGSADREEPDGQPVKPVQDPMRDPVEPPRLGKPRGKKAKSPHRKRAAGDASTGQHCIARLPRAPRRHRSSPHRHAEAGSWAV